MAKIGNHRERTHATGPGNPNAGNQTVGTDKETQNQAQDEPKTGPRIHPDSANVLAKLLTLGGGGRASFGPLPRVVASAPEGGPKKSPRWPQEAPRWPQDGPNMAPRRPKMSPRGPKMAQDGPKMAQDGPKGPQNQKSQKTQEVAHVRALVRGIARDSDPRKTRGKRSIFRRPWPQGRPARAVLLLSLIHI